MRSRKYRRAQNTAEFIEVADGTAMAVVTQVPDGAPLVLRGSSFTVYSHVPGVDADWRTSTHIAQLVAADVGLPIEAVRQDVENFLESLRLQGVLEISVSLPSERQLQ